MARPKAVKAIPTTSLGKRLRSSFFLACLLLCIGAAIRYKNLNSPRPSVNEQVGVWDTVQRDGTRYTVITRANDTNGQYFEVQIAIRPTAPAFYKGKAGSLLEHVNRAHVKDVSVVEGKVGININGTEKVFGAGEKFRVPGGLRHHMWNAGDDVAVFEVKHTPGTPDETFYENLAGHSRQGQTGLSSVNPMQLLVLFAENRLAPTELPPVIWHYGIEKFLVPLSKLMGFMPSFPQYITKAGKPLPLEPVLQPQAQEVLEEELEQPAAAAVDERAIADAAEAAAALGEAAMREHQQQQHAQEGGAVEEGLQAVDAQHMAAA